MKSINSTIKMRYKGKKKVRQEEINQDRYHLLWQNEERYAIADT